MYHSGMNEQKWFCHIKMCVVPPIDPSRVVQKKGVRCRVLYVLVLFSPPPTPYVYGIYWNGLTGCCPGNPIMTDREWKVPEFRSCSATQGWMSQLVFSICWNAEEVYSSASEVLGDGLARQGQTGKEQNPPPSVSLCKLPAEGMVQVKGVSSCLWILMKDVCLPPSKVRD